MKGGRLNKNFKCQYYRVTFDEILLHLQATKDLEEQHFQWHLHHIRVLSQITGALLVISRQASDLKECYLSPHKIMTEPIVIKMI